MYYNVARSVLVYYYIYTICNNINRVYRQKYLVYNGILNVFSNYRLLLIRFAQKDNLFMRLSLLMTVLFSLIYNIFCIFKHCLSVYLLYLQY